MVAYLVVLWLAVCCACLCSKWPDVVTIAMLHRVGFVPAGGTCVVVCVTSPHRSEALAAMNFAIEAVKGNQYHRITIQTTCQIPEKGCSVCGT